MSELPAKIQQPLPQDLIKEIAIDIGKSVAHHLEFVYPDAFKAVSAKGLRISIRNGIYNEIMASIEVTDEGKIRDRIKDRKAWRRKFNKILKCNNLNELEKII